MILANDYKFKQFMKGMKGYKRKVEYNTQTKKSKQDKTIAPEYQSGAIDPADKYQRSGGSIADASIALVASVVSVDDHNTISITGNQGRPPLELPQENCRAGNHQR